MRCMAEKFATIGPPICSTSSNAILTGASAKVRMSIGLHFRLEVCIVPACRLHRVGIRLLVARYFLMLRLPCDPMQLDRTDDEASAPAKVADGGD
jgi:hypothetical protein